MRIAFIGGGTMAEAMVRGIIAGKLARPNQISVGEPVEERRKHLSEEYGVSVSNRNLQALRNAEVVVLAIKPQNLKEVFVSLQGKMAPGHTVVSIVAGAKLSTIVDGLGHGAVVRVMPNTPGQIGQGVSVWTASGGVSQEGRQLARAIVSTLGEEVYVEDEKYVEMATALSGSGPAYVFAFLEALMDAGVYLGLPRDMARVLAVQTVLGSAMLMKQSGESPAALRDRVSSPGGTTVEGLLAMEEGAFHATVMKGVIAAYEKALRLGAVHR
jgi:pyrroline-5-carboxylate reductase